VNTGKRNHLNKNAGMIRSLLYKQNPEKLHHEVREFEKRVEKKKKEVTRIVHHDTHRGIKNKSARLQRLPKTKTHHENENPLEYSTLRGGWYKQTSRHTDRSTARKEHIYSGSRTHQKKLVGVPESHLIQSHRSDDSWHSDIARMRNQQKRLDLVMDVGAKDNIPEYLKSLVDIDGDGTIDPDEMAIMTELENVEVRDLDGDGEISPEEIMLAKKMAGKKLLAKHFVERQKGKMARYNSMVPGIGDQSFRSATKSIADARNFGPLFGALKVREARYHLSSSDLVDGCLHQTASSREEMHQPSVARYLD